MRSLRVQRPFSYDRQKVIKQNRKAGEKVRTELSKYPDYSAEVEAIDADGISEKLLNRIINKHRKNAIHNKKLMDRYGVIDKSVPIFKRKHRFEDDQNAINNMLNNDFFSEIVDFKVGYFAGKPIGYSYSNTQEAKEETGSNEAVEEAAKAITDFVTRNNMYDVDMEISKYAAICGYAGRLFYIEEGTGYERCMAVEPYEAIVLSKLEVTEPKYAVRYYKTKDINDRTIWKAEFYDDRDIYYFEGNIGNMTFIKKEPHLFDFCPLQLIPNNKEMLGDAEKVLSLIDAYDRALSDCNNEVEGFARAYMVYENVKASDNDIRRAQKTGAIQFFSGTANGKVYFLTKDINDEFTENHLDRLEENIYRFSKTPNLSDDTFGTASGIALKFKLTGLETKCGMFQAKMQAAGNYMFKLLSSSWRKKRIEVEPLQCVMDFKRNFPLDLLSEAQAAQALIAAGLPKRLVYALAVSGIDDVEWVMQQIEAEENSIPDLPDDV